MTSDSVTAKNVGVTLKIVIRLMCRADSKITVSVPMHMVQSTLEKLRGDLQRKDTDLWKMTREKEQYQGKAAAGDTTVKSLQVIVCVCYICHPCIVYVCVCVCCLHSCHSCSVIIYTSN